MENKLTSKSYHEALKQDKWLGLKCLACGAITMPPAMVCRQSAGADLDIIELKGEGKSAPSTRFSSPRKAILIVT
jgi:uncharacterized OB-fold protein